MHAAFIPVPFAWPQRDARKAPTDHYDLDIPGFPPVQAGSFPFRQARGAWRRAFILLILRESDRGGLAASGRDREDNDGPWT